jgi:hypothetical protein
LGVLLAGILVIVALVVTDGAHGHSKSATTAGKASAHRKHPAVARAPVDPLTTTDAKNWVASRSGQVSAAVENLKTGQEWLLDPNARDQTASIIKADILETLLYQAEQSGQPITSVETSVPQGMIEASDNDDATSLWDTINGASGISQYNTLAGLTQTTPNTQGFWGETLTSAADQIKILRQLAQPSKLLTPAAQAYQLGLMENVDLDENWGVSGGVPQGVTVALKNGWVPLTSNTDWEVNSIGWIKGDSRDYLLAVLTDNDPSEQYGINTINKFAADVYANLGPAGTKPLSITYGSATNTRQP